MDNPKKSTPEDRSGAIEPGKIYHDGHEEGGTMQEEWRELVERIQKETDTHKLVSLVQELIGKFDEEKVRKSTRRPPGAA